MNFDGKAFVKNISVNSYISEHGHAFVRDSEKQSINNFCLTTNKSIALIPAHLTNSKDLKNTNKLYINGLIPHTVQTYVDRYTSFNPLKFIIIRSATIHDNIQDFSYEPKKVYISKVQPTNIKYNPKSAIVRDSEKKENEAVFTGVSVNVNSKIEVVIPEISTNYLDMSIVVQKNCFIEIKLSENVTNVINLPEALTYLPGYIKGTFTQSGEYNITIKYPNGEQRLNIVVPYYQRLL